MKIGLFCNKKRAPNTLAAKKMAKAAGVWLEEKKQEVYWDLTDNILKKLDFAIIFGGDGLTLFAAEKFAHFKLPFLRVNFGYRGFLTNILPDKLFGGLEKVLHGDFRVEEKNRVEAEIFHGGKLVKIIDALNEIVIGGINRTVDIKLSMKNGGNIFNAEAHGDGLIISTKSGSTAYNLNAGGAMLFAEDAFSVVANNTYFRSEYSWLNLKTFVAPIDAEFKVEIASQNKSNLPLVVADGQRNIKLKIGDYLIIKRSSVKTLFMEIGKKR